MAKRYCNWYNFCVLILGLGGQEMNKHPQSTCFFLKFVDKNWTFTALFFFTSLSFHETYQSPCSCNQVYFLLIKCCICNLIHDGLCFISRIFCLPLHNTNLKGVYYLKNRWTLLRQDHGCSVTVHPHIDTGFQWTRGNLVRWSHAPKGAGLTLPAKGVSWL